MNTAISQVRTALDPAAYPFKRRYLALESGRLHYVDEGTGPALVFVHGTPGWSHEFYPLIQELSTTHRCIAVDHLGFGLSDKPANYAYSVDAHRDNLRTLLDHARVDRFTLVTHDFGGPIALPLALGEPQRIQRLVLMNTWFWPLSTDPTFARSAWLFRTSFMRFAYRYLNFLARFMVKAGWGTHRPLTRAQHQHFTAQFPTSATRGGTLGFLRDTALGAAYFGGFGDLTKTFSALPSLVIWGKADRLIGAPHLARWRAVLPAARFVELDGVGHFPHAEASELIAPELARFLNEAHVPQAPI